MRDTYDPRAYREDPPDWDPDPGPPSGHTTAEARRARKIEPPASGLVLLHQVRDRLGQPWHAVPSVADEFVPTIAALCGATPRNEQWRWHAGGHTPIRLVCPRCAAHYWGGRKVVDPTLPEPADDADAPATIRTARGEYRLRRTYGPAFPRPHFVELIGSEGALVCEYRVPTEADARRVARRLDLDVREGRIK